MALNWETKLVDWETKIDWETQMETQMRNNTDVNIKWGNHDKQETMIKSQHTAVGNQTLKTNPFNHK